MASLRGIGSSDGGWSDGYKKYDKATFSSKVLIFEEDGEQVFFDKYEEGSPVWDAIPLGSNINYTVNTGKSDRVQLQLIMFDTNALFEAIEFQMSRLSPQQLELLESGDDALLEEIVNMAFESKGGQEEFYVTVWSNVFNTSAEGIGTGTVRIQKDWQESSYMFVAHYGYDADGEESKVGEILLDWGLLIIGVVAMITGPLTGGAGFVVGAALLIDFMILAQVALAMKFGVATINKYDERFPQYGFNHQYVFNTMTQEGFEELKTTVSEENKSVLEDLTIMNDIKGVAAIGIMSLLLIALLRMRGA